MKQTILNKITRFPLLLPIIACMTNIGYSQKFEWVNFFQGQGTQYPVSMSVDSGGNQYSTFYFDNQFNFKSVNLNYSTGNRKGLVLKQNTDGKVLWYKTMEPV